MPQSAETRGTYELLGVNRLMLGHKSFAPERKTAALLCYLALEGAASRSKLAGLLWPDSEEATARNNLSQTLRRFRQLVEAPVIVVGDTLELGTGLEVDAVHLKKAALSGDIAAVASYRGELLGTFDYDDLPEFNDWLWSTRETLSALYREALEALVTTFETQGELTTALRYAERSVEAEPVSEIAHCHVMRLNYLLGDRPAALKAYRRCRETLARELGVTPLPETVRLARMLERGELSSASGAKQARILPLEVLRPPVLVGREDAWTALETAWAQRQTIYVTGEPGVGKTRLVQEFVASKGRGLYLPAQPGYQEVLYAGAAGLARTRIAAAPGVLLPTWVKRELARILPEFRNDETLLPLRDEADKLRFYQAYWEMVKLTGTGFIATVSDDTQYYDRATVELGGFMIAQAATLEEAGIIPRYVVVYRRGEMPAASRAAIDTIVASGAAARIDLAPLSVQSTTTFLVSLNLPLEDGVSPHFAESVYTRTGGNTLFILETLRNLLETDQLGAALPERLPLPEKVGAIVQQRLLRLSPTAQRVVQAAAVLQSDFDLELVAEVLGSDPLGLLEVWEELERAQLLSGDRFSHDLLREAVLASMSPQVGVLLQRRSAKVLAERGGAPIRIAEHYLAGGDEAKAAPHLVHAAEDAKAALRLTEAAERFERAGAIYERLGSRGEAFAAYRAALQVRLEFDLDNDVSAALVKLKRAAGTPPMRALVEQLEADWQLRRGDYRQTAAAARRGLQELEGSGDVRTRTELLTALAGALIRQGQITEGAAYLQQVLALAGTVEGGSWLALQLTHIASVLDDLGRSHEAFVYYRRALSLESSPRKRPLQLAHYGFSLLGFGSVQLALETLLEAQAQLESVHDAPITESMILTYLGAAYHHLGCYTASLASFEAAIRISDDRRHFIQGESARVRRARLYLTLGRFDEAAADLAQAQSGEQPRHPYQIHLETTLARLYTLQGRDPAEPLARTEQRLAEGARSPRMVAVVRLEQALAAPPGQRWTFAEAALKLTQDLELPGLEIAVRTLYAQQLLGTGDFAEAARQTQQAVALLARYTTSPYLYVGEVWLTHYQTLRATREPQAQVQLEGLIERLRSTANTHVPAPYRASFLEQNPVNRRILEEAENVGLKVDTGDTSVLE